MRHIKPQPKKSSSDNYAKNKLKPVSSKPVSKVVSKPKGRPLVPGLYEALSAMSLLNAHLEPIATDYYNVSVDMLEDKWILVVRGWKPGLDYFLGYEVKHIPSTLIRNPKSTLGKGSIHR